MKTFRLIVHEKGFSDEDLLINPKDYAEAKKGDIVEIYDPSEEINPRLLLQIQAFKDDLTTKDAISVKSSIATAFGLRTYTDVCMSIKNPADVALDSIELTFKDQYMGRSDMWRLKKSLTDTCVYMNKKLELFCAGAVRCQVYEMWSLGDRVACGVITDHTKVVFRSSTAMVYLFLQMSSEMWDFDIYGDLYYEKAVNGFLADLFTKWRRNGSNHEVTIVMFSRTFYEAKALEEFPLHMRECLQRDYKGRYYEDFYRVVVQNERYDDWSGILVQLRRVFSEYLTIVLEYHNRGGTGVTTAIPTASNSTAAQGNFLEVLNMSLNVFEKHYLDRSFDRTGQLSVVVTPGVGVFEVDRELTNITKQRIIDNGVGSDLVCVGEQPLHAVPLLKFHNKDTHLNVPDDYSMPHWINLSFYSTNKKIAYSNFVPRIKLPPVDKNSNSNSNGNCMNSASINSNSNNNNSLVPDEDYIHNSFFDYDAYDAQVFQLPPTTITSHGNDNSGYHHRTSKCKRTDGSHGYHRDVRQPPRRKLSDPDIQHHVEPSLSSLRSQPIAIRPTVISPLVSPNNEGDKAWNNPTNGIEKELSPPLRMVVGSEGSPPMESKALINPFDPSHVTVKLTSNRRRWTHIFPKGPSGVLIQQHHYQAVSSQRDQLLESQDSVGSSDKSLNTSLTATQSKRISTAALQEYCKKRPLNATHSQTSVTSSSSIVMPSSTNNARHPPSKSLTLLWGATGEQEWTPALTTGVDWKSLTISACLPITTDYFPERRALHLDYVVSQYNLLPDDVNADYAQQRAIYKKPLTTVEVFRELVSQRLAQGFQLILLPGKQQQQQQLQQLQQLQQQRSKEQGNTSTNIYDQSGVGTNASATGAKRAGTTGGSCGGNVTTGGATTTLLSSADSDDDEVYCLSIGRLFHKISLSGNSITVTRFRPRHPYPGFNYQYRYRFHAPHHDTYEESFASFTTEKLEHFNWNYLDHYICTRGDTDFILVDALKYWRFRVYLLPLNNTATKRILDGAVHCDVYTPARSADHDQMVDGFLKFVERIVNYNKIKRPIKSRMSLSTVLTHNATSLLQQPRRNSMSAVHTQHQNNMATHSPYRERLGSNRLSDRPRTRRGLKELDRGWTLDMPNSNNESGIHETTNDESNTTPVEPILRANTSNADILDAMKHCDTGLSFLNTHQSLPTYTFVSSEAANWILSHLEGSPTLDKAIRILKSMHKSELICHASGDFSKPFYYGFYLYHIVQINTDDKEYCPPLGDLQTFENEWLEVEIRPPLNWGLPLTTPSVGNSNNSLSETVMERDRGVPHFLCDDIDTNYLMGDADFDNVMYKRMHLEIDISNKSDRVEWGHARYQTVFRPDQAYELVVEWLTASGSIVAEMLSWWTRKAQSCGLQLVPIPHDPLALPYSNKSDPLRGPIFIPLNTKCLENGGEHLFKEFREDTTLDRIFLFQEAIIARFGFIKCLVEPSSSSNTNASPSSSSTNTTSSTAATSHSSASGGTNTTTSSSVTTSLEHQYIHCTGTVFVLVTRPAAPRVAARQRLATGVTVTGAATMGTTTTTTTTTTIGGATSSLLSAPPSRATGRYSVHADVVPSPHEAYITRHVSGKNKDDYDNTRRMGFLWSWNHMVSKRWRTNQSVDNNFQVKLLRDFREFCGNSEDRLRNYWEESWEVKESASSAR